MLKPEYAGIQFTPVEILSILYLRCSISYSPQPRERTTLTFNSLFEMPDYLLDQRNPVNIVQTFNSLFEMPPPRADLSPRRAPCTPLSILYLRCRDAQSRKRSGLAVAAFNSLFEMRRSEGAPGGRLARHLSILYLRCTDIW